MKVLEQTSNRLKLQHVPLMRWISGGLCIALSLGGLVYLIGFKPVSASLDCRYISNVQASCELRQFTWVGGMQVRKIYDLQGATVIRRSSGKRGSTYHVGISNGVNTIAFLKDSDGGSSQQEAIVAQINQFTSTPNQSPLQLQQSGRTKASLFGLFSLIGIGFGGFMTLSPATTCTFYKRLNQVVLENKSWYGSRCSVEYPLNQVSKVEIEERQVKHGRKVYRAVLVLASAERIPLNRDYTTEKDVRQVTYHIQKFLA